MTPTTERHRQDQRAGFGSGPWGRLFAAIYNPVLWAGELAGLRARRRDLLR